MKHESISDILEKRRLKARLSRDARVKALYDAHPEFMQNRLEQQAASKALILAKLEHRDTDEAAARLKALKAEAAAFKAAHHLDDAFFEPDYVCKDCGDTGFVDGKSCHCRNRLKLEQRYDMSSIREQLMRQNFERFDLSRFRHDRQPGEAVSPHEAMAEYLELFRDNYVAHFGKRSPNLYLYGPTGTGKTFMLSCIAKGVLDKGYGVLYRTAPEMLDFLTAYAFMYAQERSALEAQHEFYYDCDLLIIDDLGAEFQTDKALSELFVLINARLLAGKPTVISSNISPEELGRIYDQRIASRINGEYELFELFGSDQRTRF